MAKTRAAQTCGIVDLLLNRIFFLIVLFGWRGISILPLRFFGILNYCRYSKIFILLDTIIFNKPLRFINLNCLFHG